MPTMYATSSDVDVLPAGVVHQSPGAEQQPLTEHQEAAEREQNGLAQGGGRDAHQAGERERPDPCGLVGPLPLQSEEHTQGSRDEEVEHVRVDRDRLGTDLDYRPAGSAGVVRWRGNI